MHGYILKVVTSYLAFPLTKALMVLGKVFTLPFQGEILGEQKRKPKWSRLGFLTQFGLKALSKGSKN